MGNIYSSFLNYIFRNAFTCRGNLRILMLGLDNCGKTSILYKLKLGEVVETIPTIGFNIESISYKNISFCVWDVGGQDKLRPLWRHFFQNTQGIIYVIDSSDRNRIDESINELKTLLLDDELRNSFLLILCNKQDLENVMSIEEIKEKLKFESLKSTTNLIDNNGVSIIIERKIHILSISAINGKGLDNALDWIAKSLLNNN